MEIEYPFHTAVLFTFMMVVAVRMYYRGFADAASGVRESTKDEGTFRWLRILLGGPVAIGWAAYMLWPAWMQWAQFPLAPEYRWIGAGFSVASLAMLVWLHRHLSRNFTGTVQIRPGGHVVTTGPYRYVRHPMYISLLLLGVALLLLTANWFLGGGFLVVILLVIVVRTSLEEKKLLEAYGEEYRAYKARTAAFIPKFFNK